MNDDRYTAILLVAPVLLPLLGGAVLLVCALASCRVRTLRFGLPVIAATNLGAALLLFGRMREIGRPVDLPFGGWQVPVGISFHGDLFSSIMVLVAAIVALAGAVYAIGEIGAVLWRKHYAFFYLLLITGINGAFLTGDLFNLFVWFEVMLLASFAMMAMGRRRRTFEGATKYVVINMVSSFFFLAGLGVLYGKVGSLNLADVAVRLSAADTDPLIMTSAAMLLIAFGIKAGVFPLYFWLPASYPHTGFTTAAVFGGLLTKVGVYALFRVFGGAFGFLADHVAPLFLVCGAITIVAGVFGAVSQFHTRRILAFHIVSQIGYIVLGLGLFSKGAFAAAIFYTVHHILVKTNLFFSAGLIASASGSEDLKKAGGLLRQRPMLAFLFAIPALSLGGIPPLSGFFAKFLLIREAFREQAFLWGGIALAAGVLTLFSMTKIWSEAFWKDHPSPPKLRSRPLSLWQVTPVATLAVLTVLTGLFVGPLYEIAMLAGDQLYEQNPVVPEDLFAGALAVSEVDAEVVDAPMDPRQDVPPSTSPSQPSAALTR